MVYELDRLAVQESQPIESVLWNFYGLLYEVKAYLDRFASTPGLLLAENQSITALRSNTVFLDPQPNSTGTALDYNFEDMYPLQASIPETMIATVGTPPDATLLLTSLGGAAHDHNQSSVLKSPMRKTQWRGAKMPTFDEIVIICPWAMAVQDKIRSSPQLREQLIPTLTWISVGFASPAVVLRFCDLLQTIGSRARFPLPSDSASPSAIAMLLEQSELTVDAAVVMHRIYLAYLQRKFKLIRTAGRSQNPSNEEAIVIEGDKGQRIATVALDAMTLECYPASKYSRPTPEGDREWLDRRKRVQNWLTAGKIWYRVFKKYSYGSLALLPDKVWNQTYVCGTSLTLSHLANGYQSGDSSRWGNRYITILPSGERWLPSPAMPGSFRCNCRLHHCGSCISSPRTSIRGEHKSG